MTTFETIIHSSAHQELMARVAKASRDSCALWSRAHAAIFDARRARRAVQTQIEELAGDTEFRCRYADNMLDRILRAAISGTNAAKGTIQLVEQGSGRLVIQFHKGFEAPFLDYFQTVESGQAACGAASQRRERVLVEDVTRLRDLSEKREHGSCARRRSACVSIDPIVRGERRTSWHAVDAS